jgi:hypothetical protein
MHRNARSERSLNHRKANYDPDQFTEENSKNPSLNSTLGCLKVVDTFRRSTPPASRRGYHETSRWKVSPDKCHCGTYEWILEEYEARRAVAGIFKVDYLLVSKPE